MTGKSKGASEGKKKPKYNTPPGVKTPKVPSVKAPALCKKCSKPTGKGAGSCKCGG
jgi:hypothetical protein